MKIHYMAILTDNIITINILMTVDKIINITVIPFAFG